jgi:hypothetical protein
MERIVLQSAGTASVFVLAAILSVFQLVFALKKPRVPWYIWGAALSFSGMLYAVGVFLEYNAPAGPVNHFGGVLELAAHVLIIHSLYGLSFAYFNLNGKTYHLLAGTFHLILMVLLWGTPLIVAAQFVERRFLAMKTPFVEPHGIWFFGIFRRLIVDDVRQSQRQDGARPIPRDHGTRQ